MPRGRKRKAFAGHYQAWTSDEIAKVLELWDTKTTEEIAASLQRTKQSIVYIAFNIRKAGFDLPKKTVRGLLQGLIKDVLKKKRLIR